MKKIALLGSDIGYTRSPEIHSAISSAVGVRFECVAADVCSGDLTAAVRELLDGYVGFFVTKPYKNDIKKLIGCNAPGAVNVVRSCDKKAINTDGAGFMLALDRDFSGWRDRVNGALVLGAGGAAWAAVTSLAAAGVKTYVLARSSVRAAKLCAQTGARLYANQPVELCVNCTSAGRDDDVLMRLCVISQFEYAYEMYYAAESTPFTERAAHAGAKTATGENMLIYQAVEGDKFLFGMDEETEKIFERVKTSLARRI